METTYRKTLRPPSPVSIAAAYSDSDSVGSRGKGDGRNEPHRRGGSEVTTTEGKYNENTLPCRTYLMTGACNYGDRCKYIHDIRCRMNSKDFAVYLARGGRNCRRRAAVDAGMDAFYWPWNEPCASDGGKMYHVNPCRPSIQSAQMGVLHDESAEAFSRREVVSMWLHYLSVCRENSRHSAPQFVVRTKNAHVCHLLPYRQSMKLEECMECLSRAGGGCNVAVNLFTGRRRLPVFCSLVGEPVCCGDF